MESEAQKEEEKKENDNQINLGDNPKEEKVEKEEEDNEKENKEDEKEEKNEEEENNEEKEEKEVKDEEKKKKKKKEKKEKKEKKVKKDKKENKENKEKQKNLILTIDEENNVCCDCDKKNPTKVSINNGIIICEECALKHEELGHSISFIKDIEDDFDGYLLNFVVFGSNSKFKRFLITEQVDPSFPIEKKYLTKACFFYRNNLKRKVKGEELLVNKDYENPNELIELENIEDNYPEFEHYKMKKKVVHDGALKTEQNTKLNKLSGSILSFGKKMYGGIKFGANYVVKKTEGPTKTITKGAKIGVGFVGKQVNHAYEMIKKNVIKGKKTENSKEEENMDKNGPPKVEKKENNVMESGRPLQAGDEVQEENVEAKKEEGKDNQPEQKEDSNEEKIDI